MPPPPSNGYGRGGRGAALLEALQAPVRRPGTNGEGANGDQPVAPAGRGGLLQQMLSRQRSANGSQPGASVPIGRGIGSQSSSSGSPSVPIGRGLGATSAEATTAPIGRGIAAPLGRGLAASRPMGRGLGGLKELHKALSSVSDTQRSGSRVSPPLQSPVQQQSVSPPARQSPPQVQQQSARSSPPQVQQQSAGSSPTQTAATGSGETERPKRLSRLEYFTANVDVDKNVMDMRGSAGSNIEVSANYIYMKCLNDGVYQYAVSYNPPVDSRKMCSDMLYAHRNVIGNTDAFDGAILILPIQLPQTETIIMSQRPTDGQEVQIKIKLTKVLPPEACVQPYNMIIRRIMAILKMCQVGRYYYEPQLSVNVDNHPLEIWPGYITAIERYAGGLMMLTDVQHKLLRKETVLDAIHEIYSRCTSNHQMDQFQSQVCKKLLGVTVLTRYNNKTYRVDDIGWDMTPQSTFPTHKGGDISFLDYYKKMYNKEIYDLKQPLLIHRPKRREMRPGGSEMICLIPEMCYMTGLTDDIRSDFRTMKDISKHTRIGPQERQFSMQKFCARINNTPEAKAELSRWGLELDTDTIHFEAREAKMETIAFANGSVVSGIRKTYDRSTRREKEEVKKNADWGYALGRNRVIVPVNLDHWVVLCTRRDAQVAHAFITEAQKQGRGMGIDIKMPRFEELPNDSTSTYLAKIKDVINQHVQMIVTIFPTSRDDRYNAIKKQCCIESPVPSQVIIKKTIMDQRKLTSVAQKIVLQMNCKLGGQLWSVEIPLKGLMVCGIDVYHEGTGQSRKSVAGFVASVNEQCTAWYSRVCFQAPGQELIDGLKMCFLASLRKYHEVNHNMPSKIVVFRDGVGDGQLKTVSDYEVEQLSSVFHHFGESFQPKLSVVVVQKRINTRIFAVNHGPRTTYGNPPPGTIVDHTVTRKNWYDFFLVSQHVTQGTVSPTHYVVVHDQTGMKVDHMQRLTYKMTHLYYNWPGTIRVPAPCQYAHKLAYLVGQNLRKDFSLQLSDRLFFL